MLILIAGVTGNLGQHLARAAIARGLQIRGLGRNQSKMHDDITLESFVQSRTYYDIEALERAVAGVDAVISAYTGVPELQLDAQLLLLRAAERAGIKIFHTSSWNYDWRRMKFGEHESYDAYLAFDRIVQLSSKIKPIYLFTGVLAEVLFSLEGHRDFGPQNYGPWDPTTKRIALYGTGNEKYQWTTEKTAAEFSIEILMSEEVQSGNGGFFSACEGEHSLLEIADIYEKVKGVKVHIDRLGSVTDLEQKAQSLRRESDVQQYYSYIGAYYQLFTINGRWTLHDLHELPRVKKYSLEEFLIANPAV